MERIPPSLFALCPPCVPLSSSVVCLEAGQGLPLTTTPPLLSLQSPAHELHQQQQIKKKILIHSTLILLKSQKSLSFINIRLMSKSDEVVSFYYYYYFIIIIIFFTMTESSSSVCMQEIQKLTWQLQEGLVEFTGCSLVAAAGHPQALVGAVRLSLGLPLPFNHESRRNSGSQAEQGQEETEELQSRTGHRFQIIAGRVQSIQKRSPSMFFCFWKMDPENVQKLWT